MANLRKAAIAFGLTALTVLAIGLATAVASRSSIERELSEQLVAGHVQGRRLGGEVIPSSQITVTSRVSWPFLVEAWYFVPIDIHGRYHQVIYLVVPWGRRRISSQDFFPV
jgi:hypothetical protein